MKEPKDAKCVLIDRDVHRQLRQRALDEERTAREVATDLLRRALAQTETHPQPGMPA